MGHPIGAETQAEVTAPELTAVDSGPWSEGIQAGRGAQRLFNEVWTRPHGFTTLEGGFLFPVRFWNVKD